MKNKRENDVHMHSFLKKEPKAIMLLYLFLVLFVLGTNVANASQQQQKKIKVTGIITDETKEPMIGVSIVQKGSTNGTNTDLAGQYTLEVPSDATLQISYVGYHSQEVSVNGKSSLNIVLIENIKDLEEVVVVGYGSKKRVNLTGAIETIGAKNFESRATASAETALQGVSPGLTIQRTGGSVGGDGITMNIRGLSSINGLLP